MRTEHTNHRRRFRGVGLLPAVIRRGGGLGVLAALLLPLRVLALGPGDLDTSFSGDGKMTTDFCSGCTDTATAVALQPDGKMVVVGSVRFPSGNADFALIRYNANGTLDLSFSGDGKVTTGFCSGCTDEAFAVAIQPDGKIVVVGSARFPSGNYDFALARYNPNGSLDTSFSGDGRVTTGFCSGCTDTATAVALQPDGKMVVAGSSRNPSGNGDFALARYNANGTLDTSFSGDGRVLTDLDPFLGSNSLDVATALVIQPDGKIVAAGAAGYDPGYGVINDFALARYTSTGALDTAFGRNGLVVTRCCPFDDGCDGDVSCDFSALALQADGKLVAAGSDLFAPTFGLRGFALVRYTPNGTLDPSFGSEGRVTTTFCGGDAAYALSLQLDGKLVVTGAAFPDDFSDSCPGDVALARYNPNGTLDTAFSGDGKVFTTLGDSGRALAIQPRDGRIVVASGASGDFALARYHAHTCNGVVVTRIGTNGNDTIMGTAGNDVIFGFAGNDIIDGLGGNDMLCGGSGNDILRGGSGSDFLRGDAGTDTCDGSTGTDTATTCETVTNVP
jgi:uncharacterized delta-60 repeat protein